MKLSHSLVGRCSAVILAVVTIFSPASLRAGDNADSPAMVQDPGADINDVFLFLDPTDITQTVMIATVHGFIVPGKATSEVTFDEDVLFRFQLYNDHVNFVSPMLEPNVPKSRKTKYSKTIKPNRTIDVTFSKRQVGLGQQTGINNNFIPTNLRRPMLQAATITLTGFTGLDAKVFKSDLNGDPLRVTPFNLAQASPNFEPREVKISTTANLKFFAGVVDDPFFFDAPAYTSFVDGIRNGGAPTVSSFFRARDTYAGYNTLAIAIRLPTSLLLNDFGTFIGLDFVTMRHAKTSRGLAGSKSSGAFRQVDRMGNPLINEWLIPYDSKNAYNQGNAFQDATQKFFPMITETLKELGVDATTPESAFTALGNLCVAYGDLLQIDTSISNSGSPAGAGYDHKDLSGFASPNGRRLQDDTVDILLTTINHNMTVSDGVANSGMALSTSFPFLGRPNQPLANGATDPTQN